MKINLLIDNPGDYKNGYNNIDPFAPETNGDLRLKSDISNLDSLVDDGEANEILALEILEYFPGNVIDDILQNWLKKLAHGGILTISGVDFTEIARGFLSSNLSLEDVNELLLGKQEKSWQTKKSVFTLLKLVEVFEGLGYKILKKRIYNYRAIISIQRV